MNCLPAVLKEESSHEKEHSYPETDLTKPSDPHTYPGHDGHCGNTHHYPDNEDLGQCVLLNTREYVVQTWGSTVVTVITSGKCGY